MPWRHLLIILSLTLSAAVNFACAGARSAERPEAPGKSVETRMGNSEYDWVYDDPDSPTHWGVMWVSGCDPSDETALP